MKIVIAIFFTVISIFANANGNPSAPTMVISGIVQESGTDETLPGVKVSIEGTEFFTFTDKDGNFSFDQIPQGNYTLKFSLVSFDAYLIQIQSEQVTISPLAVVLNPR